MIHKLFIIGFLCLLVTGLQGQKDPDAEMVLQKLSRNVLRDYPIRLSFEYIYESLIDKQSHEEKGTLLLDQGKYQIDLGESVIYCDGTTLWNHMLIAEELYISEPEETVSGNDFFISNPDNLFTFYKEGFNYRLKGELRFQGEDYYEIDLFPEDKSLNYHTIKLIINQENFHLYSVQTLGKNGVNHTILLREYEKNVKLSGKEFVFDFSEWPGLEIIDTRL